MINPTGGIHHHLNGLRFSNNLWSPYRTELNDWLCSLNNSTDHLVLIGCSGGYSLESRFLGKFKKITLIDIDPLAIFIFKKRHKIKAHCLTKNYFADNASELKNLTNDFPQAHFLFCNLLGQLPMLNSSELFFNNIRETLSQLPSWASYHDLYSFPTHQKNLSQLNQAQWNKENRENDLGNLRDTLDSFTEVTDHLTRQIFPEFKSRQIFIWPRKKNYTHLVEGLSYNCY